MMFAPITRTFEMSYEDVNYETDVPEPKAYVRNKIVLPNSLEENLSYLLHGRRCLTETASYMIIRLEEHIMETLVT